MLDKIEIMAPVCSYESLTAAIQGGADAVYFGIGNLNMRSRSAANFTLNDLERICDIAHRANIRTYLTVNTIIYNNEIDEMHRLVDAAKRVGVSATVEELRLERDPVAEVHQGDRFSFATTATVQRGDKLYKIVKSEL